MNRASVKVAPQIAEDKAKSVAEIKNDLEQLVRKRQAVAKPIEKNQPLPPLKSIETKKPDESKKAAEPAKAVEPVKKVEGIKLKGLTGPIETPRLIEPPKTLSVAPPTQLPPPLEAAQPIPPVKPPEAVRPISPPGLPRAGKPEEPVKSTEPVVVNEPVKPAEPSRPVEVVKPAKPVKPIEPVSSKKSDLVLEVEANLAIATATWTGKLSSFQTKVMDANRSRIDPLAVDLKTRLAEAYTDIRLANTLVWLSMDVGHRSKDLDESYLRLCNKIAERLQSSLPGLIRSGI